ncbi:MAG: hypothetical protein ACTHLW_02170 [Verrucomicrobiota bacterium]
MSADQIGVTGKATYKGVVPVTITFGTPGNQTLASATGNTLEIFTDVTKTPMADVTNTRDGDNEIINLGRTNKRMQLSFSAKPIGANRAAALAIAANCPLIQDIVVLTCAGDAQVAGNAYVDSANVKWTPDGDLVIDFQVTKYANTFVPLT